MCVCVVCVCIARTGVARLLVCKIMRRLSLQCKKQMLNRCSHPAESRDTHHANVVSLQQCFLTPGALRRPLGKQRQHGATPLGSASSSDEWHAQEVQGGQWCCDQVIWQGCTHQQAPCKLVSHAWAAQHAHTHTQTLAHPPTHSLTHTLRRTHTHSCA